MPWRQYIDQPNPAATALMTKMQIAPGDRPKVKAQCLRLMTTLRLSLDKAELIYVFVESYLRLTAEENRIFEQELEHLEPEEKEMATKIVSSARLEGRQEGRQEGRVEGLHQGKEELLALLLQQRFSTLPAAITENLDRLTSEQMNELGVAMLSFTSLSELEEWLARH